MCRKKEELRAEEGVYMHTRQSSSQSLNFCEQSILVAIISLSAALYWFSWQLLVMIVIVTVIILARARQATLFRLRIRRARCLRSSHFLDSPLQDSSRLHEWIFRFPLGCFVV